MKRSVSVTMRTPAVVSCADDVAEDAALLEIVESFGAVHFLLHALGDHRQRDELRVGMLQRGAGRFAMVLEQEDVAEAAVLLEIVDALLEGPQTSSIWRSGISGRVAM